MTGTGKGSRERVAIAGPVPEGFRDLPEDEQKRLCLAWARSIQRQLGVRKDGHPAGEDRLTLRVVLPAAALERAADEQAASDDQQPPEQLRVQVERGLADRFGLTRPQARKLRAEVAGAGDGHAV